MQRGEAVSVLTQLDLSHRLPEFAAVSADAQRIQECR